MGFLQPGEEVAVTKLVCTAFCAQFLEPSFVGLDLSPNLVDLGLDGGQD